MCRSDSAASGPAAASRAAREATSASRIAFTSGQCGSIARSQYAAIASTSASSPSFQQAPGAGRQPARVRPAELARDLLVRRRPHALELLLQLGDRLGRRRRDEVRAVAVADLGERGVEQPEVEVLDGLARLARPRLVQRVRRRDRAARRGSTRARTAARPRTARARGPRGRRRTRSPPAIVPIRLCAESFDSVCAATPRLDRMLAVLRAPGSARLFVASMVARVPATALGLVFVLRTKELTGSFAAAGVAAGLYALASAVCAPALGRLVDRRGQPRGARAGGACSRRARADGVRGAARRRAVRRDRRLRGRRRRGDAAGRPVPADAVAGRCSATAALAHAAFALESAGLEITYIAGPVLIAGAIGSWSTAAAALTCAAAAARGHARVRGRRAGAGVAAGAARRGRRRGAARLGRAHARGRLRAVGLAFGAVEVGVPAPRTPPATRTPPGSCSASGASARCSAACAAAHARPPADRVRRLCLLLALLAAGHVLLALPAGLLGLAALLLLAGAAIAPAFGLAYGLVDGVAPAGAVTEAFTWLSTGIAAGLAVGSALGGALADGAPGGAFALAGLSCAAAAVYAVRAAVRCELRQVRGARTRRASPGSGGGPTFRSRRVDRKRRTRPRETAPSPLNARGRRAPAPSTRMIVRASDASSASETDSSTACASSMPVGADHHGRDAAGGEQAHVGAPRHAGDRRARRARRAERRAHASRPTGGRPASRPARTRRPPSRARRAPRRRRARASTTACSAARAASRSAPTGTPSRPSNSSRSGTWLDHVAAARPRPTSSGYGSAQLAHQRMRDARR